MHLNPQLITAWALMRDELPTESCSLSLPGAMSPFPAILHSYHLLLPGAWQVGSAHGYCSHSWISDFQALLWRVAQSPFWLPFESYLLACTLEMLIGINTLHHTFSFLLWHPVPLFSSYLSNCGFTFQSLLRFKGNCFPYNCVLH